MPPEAAQFGAQPGLGHQAADTVVEPTPTNSTTGWSIPAANPGAGLPDQAFLPGDWGDDWRSHLSVDEVDGAPGHELKLHGRRIVAPTCASASTSTTSGARSRCGRTSSPPRRCRWKTTSASVVVPARYLEGCLRRPPEDGRSVKLVKNCEYRLFQRPDDAIIPGFDRQTELDMSAAGNFIANFEPLDDGAAGQPGRECAHFLPVLGADAGFTEKGV